MKFIVFSVRFRLPLLWMKSDSSMVAIDHQSIKRGNNIINFIWYTNNYITAKTKINGQLFCELFNNVPLMNKKSFIGFLKKAQSQKLYN